MPENTLRIFDRIMARLIADEQDKFENETLEPLHAAIQDLSREHPVQGLREAVGQLVKSPAMQARFEKRAEEALVNAVRCAGKESI